MWNISSVSRTKLPTVGDTSKCLVHCLEHDDLSSAGRIVLVDASLVLSVTAIIISIAAIVPSYYNLFARRAEKRLKLEVERITFASNSPIPSDWSIRVLRPSNTIEHCSIEIQYASKNPKTGLPDSKKPLKVVLPVGDRQNMYEIKIPKDGNMNFRVPKGIVADGSLIVVKDRMKELLRRKAQEIPLVNP
jgi:hypothetical protein